MMHIRLDMPGVARWHELWCKALRQEEAGQFALALETLQQALEHARRAVPDRLLQVATLERMAYMQEKLGWDGAAARFFETALSVVDSLPGARGEVEKANTLMAVARHYFRRGRLEKAEQLCRQAESLYRKRLGDRHAFVAIADGFRANILYQRGEFDQAAALIERVLPRLQKFADDPTQVVNGRQLRAKILHKLGKTRQAIAELRALSEFAESPSAQISFGPEFSAGISRDLCEILLEDGQAAEAHRIAWEILSRLEKHFPPTAPVVEAARQLVAQAARQLSRQEEQALIETIAEEDGLEKYNLANRRWLERFVQPDM